MAQEKFLDAEEAAKEIGVSASLLKYKARRNEVRHRRRGDSPRGKFFFPIGEVKRLKRAYSFAN